MMQLVLSNVTKSYTDGERTLTVLKDVSYEFDDEKSYAIIGRSGIGKSTLLNMIAGLDRATSGEIVLNGSDYKALSEESLAKLRGANIGFIFQSHHLLPEFTALENVAMPLIIQGVPRPRALEAAAISLDKVGLQDRVKHRPSQLSGGEQQRVAIARAIVTEPAILVADEPTGNLDTENAELIQALLLKLQKEIQTLLIVVTHSKELARKLDVTLEMHPGGKLTKVETV